MIDKQLSSRIERAGVLAVITIDDPSQAVPLSRALLAGGVTGIELTLRTPDALRAIEAIARETPSMMVGAGTVLTPEQLTQVKDAGATFAVSPGLNRDVVIAADKMGFPFAPGVMTPSEIEAGISLGCSILKFYHAGVAGGLKAFQGLTTPYAHLGLRFVPLGGVSQENMREWLGDRSILAVGGSWIAPRADITSGAWETITKRAATAKAAVDEVRGLGVKA